MLRRKRSGRQDGEWTKDQVIAGLLKFYEIHNRFPKASEIDTYEYLPTARSIQRNFNGILALKTELGIKDIYHAGPYRSQIAKDINSLNDKLDKYRGVDFDLYLVCANPELQKSDIERLVDNKITRISVRFHIESIDHFLKSTIEGYVPLTIS
jgi:hypothetical protein